MLITILLAMGLSAGILRLFRLYKYHLITLTVPFTLAILWELNIAGNLPNVTELLLRMALAGIAAAALTWALFNKGRAALNNSDRSQDSDSITR